ncbi:MAG: 23S rRNA (pseudouridine(1915)-N(3))-methyltransferase RlmH [Anaerolineaceae bacterium]|nr:MAG: 23S rRNA (pseudouridine(1915)-N(3))-methyltransferase RlmH [Anaerolineaceae bacterium]
MKKGRSNQITVAAVGKLRRREWQAVQVDYLRRLQRYADVELVEVKDAVGQGFPDAVALLREGEQLLKATAVARQRILLTSDGREMSSVELASFIQKRVETYGQIAFLLGGPLGFADGVIEAANMHLSLSRLTFPHELARILFLEQLYRAFTILRGEKYHK